MRIGLVSHVPNNAVVGRIEDMVQCHRQFHDPQASAKVPSGSRHAKEQILAQLLGKMHQVIGLHLPQFIELMHDRIE